MRILQRHDSLPRFVGRTIHTRALEREEDAVANAPNGRRGDGRTRGHMCGQERAADSAEIVAIEKVGHAGFVDGEDELSRAFMTGHVNRNVRLRRGPDPQNRATSSLRERNNRECRSGGQGLGRSAGPLAIAPGAGAASCQLRRTATSRRR